MTVTPPTSPDAYKQMLQNLLSERFRLIVHRETKEVAAYELVVAPGGPKVTASPVTSAPSGSATVPTNSERPLADVEGFPIVGPDQLWAGPKEVSAALEKQLGLKLNPIKTSLDYIVVDKVSKVPTEN